MKNKSKKMYGKLSALLLSVVLMMTGLSVTALAAGENLIDAFDPTFEAGLPETLTKEYTYDLSKVELGTDGGYSGENYVKLTETGDFIRIYAPVEPAKSYDFSFWMRNSKENVLQLGACYFYVKDYIKDGVLKPFYTMAFGGTGDWDWMTSSINSAFGVGTANTSDAAPYTFGIKRGDDKDDTWRQVTINFSTPPVYPGQNVTHVNLDLNCISSDEKLAIDNLSLVETDKKPNRVFNGDFEAIRNDKDSLDASGISYTKGSTINTEIVTEENGNHYLKVDCSESAYTHGGADFHIRSPYAALLRGIKSGTRYKLSFKAKVTDKEKDAGGYKRATIQLDTSKNGTEFLLGNPTNEWKTYTMYIDHTQPAKDGLFHPSTNLSMVRYANMYYVLYVDDVYAWYDESNIGFYKSLNFNYAATGERGLESKSAGLDGYDDVIMTENGVEAESLAALTPENRTVKVRAHYLPDATWGTDEQGATTVSFDETTVTLLAAVYKYETKNGVETKTLVDVKAANGTSSVNGETIDVVTEVSVPENSTDVRYEVEAVALNMDNLKPIVEKAVLR